MKYTFHQEASIELKNAIKYYEDFSSGLGRKFASEVLSAIDRILEYPELWTILEGNIRRKLVNIFRYGVVYRI